MYVSTPIIVIKQRVLHAADILCFINELKPHLTSLVTSRIFQTVSIRAKLIVGCFNKESYKLQKIL